MPAAIDQSTDITSQMRHVIQKIHTVPEFVKAASDNDQFGDPEVLQNHVYADPSKRRFPCHTKAATWLSAAYFAHQQSQYSKTQGDFVRDRILKTAQFFNIEPGVRELFKEAAAVNSYEDAVTPDTAYALIWTDASGAPQKSYPMRNPSEVKVAADWFNKNWTDFDFDTRHEVARKLFTKLAELQVTVDDSDQIERCAGFGYCEKEAMQKAWETRAILSRKKYPEYSKQASVLAQSIADNTFDLRDFSLRTKMASSMDDFDSVTMLRKFYGGSIDWPENTLFSVTQKVASEFINDHVMTTSGAVYEHADLKQLTAGDLRDWMGDDFMAKCGGVIINHRKLAEVLPTLTREDARLFEKLAVVKGISTVGRTHGEPTGVTDDELHEFASAYSVSR
jgi:hypothetical protein